MGGGERGGRMLCSMCKQADRRKMGERRDLGTVSSACIFMGSTIYTIESIDGNFET